MSSGGFSQQSIYRFRRADIEIYEEAKRVVRKQGEVMRIGKNCRTVGQLIDMVNGIFERLIIQSTDGAYQPEYVTIFAGRTVPSHDELALLLLPPTRELGDKEAKQALRQE